MELHRRRSIQVITGYGEREIKFSLGTSPLIESLIPKQSALDTSTYKKHSMDSAGCIKKYKCMHNNNNVNNNESMNLGGRMGYRGNLRGQGRAVNINITYV